MLNTSIGRLRAVGVLEGLSFLLLLLVAMPLKYLAGMPEMVRVVGSAHGFLFLLYVAALGHVALERRWPLRRVGAGLVASVLPGGPFVFDARVLREELAEDDAARRLRSA
jgi:integral membrane protein